MEKEKLTQLVIATQQGDQEAASELYLESRDELYYYIMKTVNDPVLAEDLLQDSFMEILQTIEKLNAPEAYVTWSRQIAYHRCTAYFRKRHDLLADENEDGQTVFDTVQEDRAEFIPDEALDKEDLKITIVKMIDALPEVQRTALILRYYDELPLEDIAKIQNVPLGTVKTRLSAGRKAMKATVEEYEKKNGIKLHSVAILPLLLWFFREKAVAAGASLTKKGVATVAAAASTSATAAAATTATAATATAAAKTTATAAGVTAAKAGAKGLAVKIVAGVLAAAVVIGGGAVALNIINNDSGYEDTQDNEDGGKKKPKPDAGDGDIQPEDPQEPEGDGPFLTPPTSLTVDLNRYADIFYNYDDGLSYGADAYIDQEELIKDISPFITGLYTKQMVEQTLQGSDNHNIDIFQGVVTESPAGDTVQVHWEVNERGLALLQKQVPGVEFKYEDATFAIPVVQENTSIGPVKVLPIVEKEPVAQINLEDYVSVYVLGSDGYGEICIQSDFERFKADCEPFLIEDGNLIAADFGQCDKTTDLSNGDKVTLTITNPLEGWAQLSIEIQPVTIEYTVKGLPAVESIDPFVCLKQLNWSELVSANGTVGYKLGTSGQSLVKTPDGIVRELRCSLDVDKERVYLPEDTIHISLDEDTVKRYKEVFGDQIFSRTEADLKVADLYCYLPTGDRAGDIFEYMDEACLDNVDYAIKKVMDDCTETDTTVECIGMMFYYDDEGVLDKNEDTYKFYNRLVFIYKITNADRPEGWYSYMALNGASGVGWQVNRAEGKMEMCTAEIYGDHMFQKFQYYQNEHFRMAKDGYPASFIHNGVEYPGHTELSDVFAAIKATMPCEDEYDHLIVTDNLKSYVQTY